MADNKNGNLVSLSDYEEDVMAIAYTTARFVPVETVFRLTQNNIEQLLLDIARDYVDDFTNATLDVTFKSGDISAFVWLNKDSKHMQDKTMRNSNDVLKNRTIVKYSDELKKFIARFCFEKDKRFYNDVNSKNLVGFKVDLTKFLVLAFDESGDGFKGYYNSKKKVPSRIRIKPEWITDNGNRRTGFAGLTIKKVSRYGGDKKRPRASFNGRG